MSGMTERGGKFSWPIVYFKRPSMGDPPSRESCQMKSKKKKKPSTNQSEQSASNKILRSRSFDSIEYVLFSDIDKFHGKKWAKRFGKLLFGSTCVLVPAGDPSHKQKKEQIGIYYWDYVRFRDLIDKKRPTYWD